MGEAPVLDFDNSASFASQQLMTFMCWPDPSQRKLRLATFGALVMTDDSKKLADVLDRMARLSNLATPTRQLAERIVQAYTSDPELHSRFWAMVETYAPPATSARPVGWTAFDEFMAFCRTPLGQSRFLSFAENVKHRAADDLFDPNGGIKALTVAPPFAETASEIADQCEGHAMHAGLIVALIACCDRNHAHEFEASVNRICFVLDEMHEIRTSTSTIKSHSWPTWRSISPLWAGVIAEFSYQPLSLHALLAVCKFEDRRARAISYARWFAEFATARRGVRRKPLIKPSEIMRFECAIAACEPPLPRLSDDALSIACAYTTRVVETSYERKSRK